MHVDLDEIRVISHALFDGAVSVQEARVAVALLIHPELTGLRAIEAASGLCDDTLLAVIPAEGFSSDLLICRTRGSNAWELEDRRPMVVEYRSPVGRKSHSSLQSLEDLREISLLERSGEDEVYARQVSAFLDPSLDCWSNRSGQLGDAGWALAMVTLMRSVTLGLKDLARIMKVGERQVRRNLERLGGWVRRVKEGRTVRVVADFSLMALDELKAVRRARKARLAQCDAEGEQMRDTAAGRAVKELWANRRSEVKKLREVLEAIPARGRQHMEQMIRLLSAARGEGPVARHRLRQLFAPLSV